MLQGMKCDIHGFTPRDSVLDSIDLWQCALSGCDHTGSPCMSGNPVQLFPFHGNCGCEA
jgi:hypothetical protein